MAGEIVAGELVAVGSVQAGSFEKNSLDWQLHQLQQQGMEWLERFLSNWAGKPDQSVPQLPDWLLRGLFWLMVIGAASFVGWQLYRLLRPYLAARLSRLGRQPRQSLPQPELRSLPEWLEQSRTAQQQGNYREACRALYMAALQQLSDRSLIDQQASRTDGEYLRLLPTIDRSQPYQVLIQTHERLCFSESNISVEQFDRCWQAFQQLMPSSQPPSQRSATP